MIHNLLRFSEFVVVADNQSLQEVSLKSLSTAAAAAVIISQASNLKAQIAKDKTSQTKKVAKNNKTINYSSGAKYIGETQNGKPDGHGTYSWSNGNKYVGKFKNGTLHGHGTFSWSDGSKYEGTYVAGKK